MNEHREYRYRCRCSDTVIVFTHGILGSPLQFEDMVEKLGGSYSVENLLLPGHGKTIKEFRRSGMAEWQAYVDERVRLLQRDYKNIVLVGHSMGCLLSIQTAVSYPLNIKGLFLTALPLFVHFGVPYLKNIFTVGFSRDICNPVVAASRRLNSVSVSNPFEYLKGSMRYIELLNKIRASRELLRELNVPVMVLHSARDVVVSEKTLRFIDENSPDIRYEVLRDSGHFYYPAGDRERALSLFVDFISGLNRAE
ncbi:MAG: alpha/beta hydrolase [Oscillospiraceae bacterium]